MDLLHLFFKGGFVMYPILLSSIISLMIALERFFYYKKQQQADDFDEELTKALRGEDYEAAKEFCKKEGGAVSEVLLVALAERGKKVRQEEIVQAAAKKKALELRRYLEYLSVIVTMAPLLGLLGTVTGMISSFSVLSISEGQPFAITGGVGEALIATASGLLAAIFALCLYTWLSHRANAIIAGVEYTSSMYLALVGVRNDEA